MDRYTYRGKRIDCGAWEQGYYCLCRNHFYILQIDITGQFDDRYFDWIEIDPETLGQCTGIVATKSYRGESNNDRMLFEGDIVKYDKYIGTVAFGCFNQSGRKDIGFWIDWSERYFRGDPGHWIEQGAEIIGNIHEHADLLEVGNEL